jgi:glutathione peroxidase
LKWVYPLFIQYKNLKRGNRDLEQARDIVPPASFYNLSALLNSGTVLPFENLKGKKVLIVNTASNCGYTRQYAELQQLYESHKERLTVIAFPSNDFKEQEKGSDEEIARFCRVHYGVSFPLVKKSVVLKGGSQNGVFKWLTSKALNGWNDRQPSWNFSKYLINEKGHLTHYFDPAVSPLSTEVINAIADDSTPLKK